MNLTLETLLMHVQNGSKLSLNRIFNVYNASSNWKRDEKFHANFHILFVKKGYCTYIVEGESVKLETGDVMLVLPKTHYRALVDESVTLSVFSLRFDIESKKGELENPYSKPGYILLRPKNALKYRRIFFRMHIRSNQINNPYEHIQLNAILTDLIVDIYTELESGSALSEDDSVYLIKTYVEEHPDAILNNEKMAEMAMMSVRSLQRHFKKKMGMSPYAFVVRTKMNYSTLLLEETNMTILEVATFLGYSDQFSFSKQFKKQLGFSPSDYIKQNRMAHLNMKEAKNNIL